MLGFLKILLASCNDQAASDFGQRDAHTRELSNTKLQKTYRNGPNPINGRKKKKTQCNVCIIYPEEEFSDVIGTKVSRVFLLAIHSHPLLTDFPPPPPPPP